MNEARTSQTSHRGRELGWSDQLEPFRAEIEAVDRRIRTMARTQPLTVVAVALAAGFMLGRIIRG
jgi:hypothetical protein